MNNKNYRNNLYSVYASADANAPCKRRCRALNKNGK